MSYIQAILMAVLQGVTELFPVSSLGHAVIVPAALLWPIHFRGPGYLPFLVILHLGTATALLAFFWRDWIGLAQALIGGGDPEARPVLRRLVMMLVIGTIPAAILGYLFNHAVREMSPRPRSRRCFSSSTGSCCSSATGGTGFAPAGRALNMASRWPISPSSMRSSSDWHNAPRSSQGFRGPASPSSRV